MHYCITPSPVPKCQNLCSPEKMENIFEELGVPKKYLIVLIERNILCKLNLHWRIINYRKQTQTDTH
jgi:hypothetical protein